MASDPLLVDVLNEVVSRESIFRRPEFQMTRAGFEPTMRADFWEVGVSRNRYSREYVLNILEKRCASRTTLSARGQSSSAED